MRKSKKHRLPNVRPGEILLEEFLKPMSLSQTKLANAIAARFYAKRE